MDPKMQEAYQGLMDHMNARQEPQKPADYIAGLRLEALKNQKVAADNTAQQLAELQNKQRQTDLTPLAMATDFLTGSKFTDMYSKMRPQDTTKEKMLLSKLHGEQNEAIAAGIQGMENERYKQDHMSMMERLQKARLQQANINKAPSGFRYLPDGNLEIIPGGPVALEQEDVQRQRAANADVVTKAGQTVIRDISTAIDMLDEKGSKVAGAGSVLNFLPGSDAKNFKADIDSIKGNVAVDQLLKIKKSGAGLGQVPQSQLDMLAGLLGGLDPEMSPPKLKKNLKDIQSIYTDIVKAEGGDPFKLARQRGYKFDEDLSPVPNALPEPAWDTMSLEEINKLGR